MKKTQLEKKWKDLVDQKSIEVNDNWGGTYVVGLKEGIKFVRTNLSQIPEIKEFINNIEKALKNRETNPGEFPEDDHNACSHALSEISSALDKIKIKIQKK